MHPKFSQPSVPWSAGQGCSCTHCSRSNRGSSVLSLVQQDRGDQLRLWAFSVLALTVEARQPLSTRECLPTAHSTVSSLVTPAGRSRILHSPFLQFWKVAHLFFFSSFCSARWHLCSGDALFSSAMHVFRCCTRDCRYLMQLWFGSSSRLSWLL